MRKVLLSTTSLLGVALGADTAAAADGIKLAVGGFFREAYMVVFDDDSEGELGNERNTDGFFNDAEIHFTGSTILDNGLEVGARVELEGETEEDQIDEAWVFFSGGFGEVRIGSEDEALANACIVPPGGTTNFSAFSPNQWGANTGVFGLGAFSSNSVCSGVDGPGDAQKIVYISPVFAGFQLTASYTPNESSENHTNNGGPHVGMTEHTPFQSRHNVSVYGTYSYTGEDWGINAGLGASFEGHLEEGGSGPDVNLKESDFYQAGLNLTFGNFGIGVVGEYYNDVFSVEIPGPDVDYDIWVAGIGASYAMDAWTFGLQYSHREDDVDNFIGGGQDLEFQQDRAVATVNYALGPGILVDAELGYTWIDLDPEADGGADDYQALELGIGTAITF